MLGAGGDSLVCVQVCMCVCMSMCVFLTHPPPQILLGYVKRTYWSGTTFRSEDEQLYPPYLSFLGSKTFARTAHTHASSGEAAEQKVTQDDATP